jgi:hypothetical protein
VPVAHLPNALAKTVFLHRKTSCNQALRGNYKFSAVKEEKQSLINNCKFDSGFSRQTSTNNFPLTDYNFGCILN